VNVETKKQWMHIHSPKKPKKLKHTLFTMKLMASVFLDRKGVLVMEFMQQRPTLMSDVYCKPLNKNSVGTFRKKGVDAGIHCSVPRQHTPAYRCLYSNTARAFNWKLFYHSPNSPESHFEQLPSASLPEELVEITALQQ
jgi:hypothetical protein